MVTVEYSKTEVVHILRETGYTEAAAEAERVLPERIDFDELLKWGGPYGVTRDQLISRMGGSP